MDERMNTGSRFIGCLLLGALYAPAGAPQSLGDPMMPARVSPEPDAPAAGSRLRSVILSPQRKLAVIDGQLVALGGKIGEATLVALSESEAVLRNGEEVEHLQLLPGTDKKRPATTRSGAPAKGEKGGTK